MNIFTVIKERVEKNTGLECVYESSNILDNQVMVSVKEIEKTGVPGQYRVFGNFSIKTGIIEGWQNLNHILNMDMADTRCLAMISDSGEGYALMSIEFSMIMNEEKERTYQIKTSNIEGKNVRN